jgi:LPXTG-motif cell wall-anchored protein
MGAFRFVAMAYALAVFLIAPAWLAAEEEPTTVPVPQAPEEPAAAADPVTAVTEPAPDADAVAEQADTLEAEAQAEPEPAPAPAPEAEPAKKEKVAEPKHEDPTAKASATASVTISDFKFTPATVTVNEGDTVNFTNDGPTVHTATADDGSFDTGILEKGQSGSATFTSAGTVTYYCQPHPNMKGTVVVQAASTGGGSPGGDDTGSDDGSAVAGEDTTSGGSGSGLPATGGETLSILLLGAATLGVGLLLRRRET